MYLQLVAMCYVWWLIMIGDDDYSADDTICCRCYYFSASAVGVCVDDN